MRLILLLKFGGSVSKHCVTLCLCSWACAVVVACQHVNTEQSVSSQLMRTCENESELYLYYKVCIQFIMLKTWILLLPWRHSWHHCTLIWVTQIRLITINLLNNIISQWCVVHTEDLFYSILFKCSCNKQMICSLYISYIYWVCFFLIHPNDSILWLKLSVYTHWCQCPLTFPELISDAHSIRWILEQSPSSSETSLLSLRPPCKLVVLKLWAGLH